MRNMFSSIRKKYGAGVESLETEHKMFLLWLSSVFFMCIGFSIMNMYVMSVAFLIGIFAANAMTSFEILRDIKSNKESAIYCRVITNMWYIVGIIALFIVLHV